MFAERLRCFAWLSGHDSGDMHELCRTFELRIPCPTTPLLSILKIRSYADLRIRFGPRASLADELRTWRSYRHRDYQLENRHADIPSRAIARTSGASPKAALP